MQIPDFIAFHGRLPKQYGKISARCAGAGASPDAHLATSAAPRNPASRFLCFAAIRPRHSESPLTAQTSRILLNRFRGGVNVRPGEALRSGGA